MPDMLLRERIRSEYLEMPGLRLTLGQAQRLFGVERTMCKTVLDALVGEQFLCVKTNIVYARATDGSPHPPIEHRSAPRDNSAEC